MLKEPTQHPATHADITTESDHWRRYVALSTVSGQRVQSGTESASDIPPGASAHESDVLPVELRLA